MPAGKVDRNVLASNYQQPGDIYQDGKTEGAFEVIAQQVDDNYNYTKSVDDFSKGLIDRGVLSRLGVINVKDYGAKGDGITDDRKAIQDAIDYAETIGGVKIIFPKIIPQVSMPNYAILSEHPSYPGHGLVVKSKNIIFEGTAGYVDNTTIKLLKTNMISLLYIPANADGFKMTNMNLHANKNADYALKADEVYSPRVHFTDCQFDSANVANCSIATFVSVFDHCEYVRGTQDGLILKGIDGAPVTSVTMNSCYANNNARRGFNFGFLTYCTLNACAADHCDIAYYFGNAYGVSMNACGTEAGRKAIEVDTFRGLTINTFYGLGMGVDGPATTDYLIEFKTGTFAVLSGIYFNISKTFKKILGLTTGNTALENITILDDSIRRSQVDFVANLSFDRPIKFLRGDETNVAVTKTINAVDLPAEFAAMRRMKLHHDYNIKLNNGTGLLTDTTLQELDGVGRVIIEGNATDNTLVQIDCGYRNLTLKNNKAVVIFKNLTFTSTFASPFNLRALIDNSVVIFDNCIFMSGGINAGQAFSAFNQSKVFFINGTLTTSDGFWKESDGVLYKTDNTSEFIIAAQAAAPTVGEWRVGNRFKVLIPVAGGYAEQICVTNGAPGTWKGSGLIQA